MFVLLSQSKCVLLVSQGLPCPQLSLSEFQAFRLRSFLELRHGGCSVWLAHGSSLLMVFGSLAPLWCLASVPSEHARLAHLPSEADGSCASVLAERTHCVGPLDVWSVLASVFPSMRTWRICLLRRMEVVLRSLPSGHVLCRSSGYAVSFSIGHPRACAVCALALVRAVWHVVAE